MQVLKVSEILQREVGEQIPAARGTLKAVFKRSQGTSSVGAWSIQNAVLTDGQQEIKLKLMNKEPVDGWKGKEVYLLATHDDKKGFSGLLYKQEKYTSKKTGQEVTDLVLEVQDKGSITLNQPPEAKSPQTPPPNVPCDSEGRPLVDPDEGEPERPKPTEAPKGKAPLTPQEKWAQDERAVHDAARCLAQFSNLYLLVSEAVRSYVAPVYQIRHGVSMTPEQIQTCTTTFYIDAQKRGLAGTLPVGPIEPFLKPKGGQQ